MSKKNILIVAPHADDETLGCGGTILNHKKKGDKVYCCIVTSMKHVKQYSEKQYLTRDAEIRKVKKLYNLDQLIELDLPATTIDTIPLDEIIKKLDNIINKIKPNQIYIPFHEDAHTDHQILAKISSVFAKWFRYPFIKKVLCYEILSETNFNFNSDNAFKPNVFIDISKFLDKKISIMKVYKSEIQSHPFPRSKDSIKSLAILRGSQCGFKYAEGFKLIIDRS